jgi:hypothetical protein
MRHTMWFLLIALFIFPLGLVAFLKTGVVGDSIAKALLPFFFGWLIAGTVGNSCWLSLWSQRSQPMLLSELPDDRFFDILGRVEAGKEITVAGCEYRSFYVVAGSGPFRLPRLVVNDTDKEFADADRSFSKSRIHRKFDVLTDNDLIHPVSTGHTPAAKDDSACAVHT